MHNIQQTLNHALQLHQAGHFPEAEKLYKQCLQQQPNNPDALHLLGVLAFQAGKNDTAKNLIEQALKIDKKNPAYLNNLGNVFQAQGDMDKALNYFKKAHKIDSHNADALNNIGAIYLDRKEYKRALNHLRRATQVAPQMVNAVSNLGFALLEMGEIEEGKTTLQKALELDPNHVKTHRNLGIMYLRTEDFEEAEKELRIASRLAPNDASLYRDLATVAFTRKRLDDAEAAIVESLRLDENNAPAWVMRGTIERSRGDMDKATEYFNKALEIDPDCTEALFCLAYIHKINTDNPLLEKLQKLEQEPSAYIHYALGKAYKDIKEDDKSFEHFNTGATLHRQTLDYRKETEQGFIDALINTFTSEFLEERKNWGNPDATPVFVLGMPRSGTSLVEQILASHPDVFGAGELLDLKHVAQRHHDKIKKEKFPAGLMELTREDFHALGQVYLDKIIPFKEQGVSHVVDKMPGNYHYIGLIKTILPNAKIIHCNRDAVDTCLSCFTHLFTVGQDFSYNLEELADYYNQYKKLMAHWQGVLTDGFYDIHYENLINHQEKETHKLLDYCGLSWQDACLDFHKTKRNVMTASVTQVRQPIYKTSVKAWKRYEKHLKPLLDNLGT